MNDWKLTIWCPHGRAHTVRVDPNGMLDLPLRCCVEQPRKPSRLRVWWEARRFRRVLRGWRGEA